MQSEWEGSDGLNVQFPKMFLQKVFECLFQKFHIAGLRPRGSELTSAIAIELVSEDDGCVRNHSLPNELSPNVDQRFESLQTCLTFGVGSISRG